MIARNDFDDIHEIYQTRLRLAVALRRAQQILNKSNERRLSSTKKQAALAHIYSGIQWFLFLVPFLLLLKGFTSLPAKYDNIVIRIQ